MWKRWGTLAGNGPWKQTAWGKAGIVLNQCHLNQWSQFGGEPKLRMQRQKITSFKKIHCFSKNRRVCGAIPHHEVALLKWMAWPLLWGEIRHWSILPSISTLGIYLPKKYTDTTRHEGLFTFTSSDFFTPELLSGILSISPNNAHVFEPLRLIVCVLHGCLWVRNWKMLCVVLAFLAFWPFGFSQPIGAALI